MRAALLTRLNAPLELADIEPHPLQYGQVLVKMLCAGICGAQLQEISGAKESGPMPHPLGHEGCGIVQEIGVGVSTVRVGDKVVLHWRKGDGIESDFPLFQGAGYSPETARIISGGKVTTFSEYTVVSENRCTAVPMDTPDELCAMLGCGLSTAIGTIESEAKLLMGESVLIIGCGGLGLNLILAARLRLAKVVVAVDSVFQKSRAAYDAGATFFVTDIDDTTNFDVVIDTSGNADAIARGIAHLAPSGRFIMVGQPSGDVLLRNARSMFDGEGKTIKATQGGGFRPHLDIKRYVDAYNAGRFSIDGLISHRLPLERINEGIDLVRSGQAGRVLITMP